MPGSISFCTRAAWKWAGSRAMSLTSVAKLMVIAMISSFWRARYWEDCDGEGFSQRSGVSAAGIGRCARCPTAAGGGGDDDVEGISQRQDSLQRRCEKEGPAIFSGGHARGL